MQMIPVVSSNLVAVGFDEKSNTLRVQFHSGTYDYTGVPKSIYEGLMSAASKGEYHAQFIKNAYPYRRC